MHAYRQTSPGMLAYCARFNKEEMAASQYYVMLLLCYPFMPCYFVIAILRVGPYNKHVDFLVLAVCYICIL